MDKSLKIFIIVVLLLAVVVTIILVMANKPKNSKNLKSRFDELDNCHDICFEKFPFQWQAEKRQNCMNTCLPDEGLNKNLSGWEDKFGQCLDQKCDTDKCFMECDNKIKRPLPPVEPLKPERSRFNSDEDFYRALDEFNIALDEFNAYDFEYKSKLYPNYVAMLIECKQSCDNKVPEGCKKKCCEEAKECDKMTVEREQKNCKMSCSNFRNVRRM
jgi:hypothetical protein